MARSYAPLLTTIWSDEDFVALSPMAQRTYLLAFSQPNITYCGVVAFTVKRWARMSAGTTTEEIDKAVTELAEAGFVVVDLDTEELWVRSFVRHNGVLGQPQLAKAMARSFDEILSPAIRTLFLNELPEDLPQACEGLNEARAEGCSQAAGSLNEGSGTDLPNPEPEPASVTLDPDLASSSAVTSTAPAASSDDEDREVWIELARLKADASPDPVVHFERWSQTVIADDSAKLGPALTAFRAKWPNASSAELARALFDGTGPPAPPKQFTHGCGDVLVGLDAYQDHLADCDFVEASDLETVPRSPYPQEARG